MKRIIIDKVKGMIETPANFIVPAKHDLLMLDSGNYCVDTIQYDYIRNEIIVFVH